MTTPDRYYGEDYRLFGEIDQAGAFFVIRIKGDAVVNVEQELALSAEELVRLLQKYGARKPARKKA